MCVFSFGDFLPPDKKNPRDDAAGEGPTTKQAKGKSNAKAWLLLAYLPLVDTMHHALKAWCIIVWVQF